MKRIAQLAALMSIILFAVLLPAQQRPAPAQQQPAPAATASGAVLSPAQQQPAPTPAEGGSELLVGSGDLLQVSVYGAPDFDKVEARVAANGDITLPLVGATHVGGLTVSKARDVIAEKLNQGQYFNQPQVSVLIKEYATQGVSVLGEVQKPGVYPVMGPRKLYDVISAAGGVTPKAGDVVSVTRRSGSAPLVVKMSNDPIKGAAANIDIEPGDTVAVSKAGIVYVVGDVKLPGGFVMENGKMSILQALAMAQGTTFTSALSSARLIRNTPTGQQETPVDLKKVLSSQAPNMQLQAEDILFVPGSRAKSAGRRTLEAIIQTASGMAIYRP